MRGSSSAAPASSLRAGDLASSYDSYQGTIELNAISNSGLTGTITLNYQTDSKEIAIYALAEFPCLLNWQLQYLRTLWQVHDWPPELSDRNSN